VRKDPIVLAQDMLKEQAEALAELGSLIGEPLREAVELILATRDQVVLTGLGKSGLIARKIAATLASTGTPAIFMHPVEGVHGDLGAVGPNAVLVALSKSGHTDELVRFVGHFRRLGGKVIAVCESNGCPLVELADVFLAIPARCEAGPLALAPTTSTLLMLALGDALAMALLDARGFSAEAFAKFHPDGSLGRRLLLRVADLMHRDTEMPCVSDSAKFNELLLEMTGKRLGMTCIVNAAGHLLGVFTDGDLRRLLTRSESPGKLSALEAWKGSRRDPSEPAVRCSTISSSILAVDALRMMRESEITVLVVSDDGNVPIGIVRLQDLVKAGLS